MDCLFCNIANGKTDTEILFQDKDLAVFRDINPKAPVHLLIVPKIHIESVNEIKEKDKELLGEMIFQAREMAKKFKIEKGYRLIFNVGKKGGQLIDHIHLHLIGGW